MFKKKPRKFKKTKSEGKIPHKKTTIDEIEFDSKMESEYYEYLKELKANGMIRDFSLQPQYMLQEKFVIILGELIYGSDVNFEKLKRKHKAPTISAITYKADFKIIDLDYSERTVETKGRSTPEFELRKKMLLHKYPSINYFVLIKHKDTWLDYYEHMKAERLRKKEKAQGGVK